MRSFVMADLPGLIEGAHEGVGLGHEFLRHVERTRVIIHVVDMAASEGRDPYEDWVKINEELVQYNEKLAERPQIIAANKMDMPDAEEFLEMFKQQLKEHHGDKEYEIVPISSLTKQGIQELLYKAADMLDAIPETLLVEEVKETEERKVFKYNKKKEENDFTIRVEEGVYVVESENIEKFMQRHNLNSYDEVMRFARIMRKMGVDNELRKAGAKDGDLVRIGDFAFEFFEGSDYIFE